MAPSFSIRRTVQNLPIPWKLTLIIGLFCAVIALLLTLSYLGLEILSSARAYVRGEGLWSKSQKQAVVYLERYVWSHHAADYDDFQAALEIPLGDHQARMELEKPEFNWQIVFDGFLQGGNDAEDIPGMIRLMRTFGWVGYLTRAIGHWREGDEGIARLQAVSEAMHEDVQSGRSSRERMEAQLQQVRDINNQLTAASNAFSATLGEGARWLKKVLLLVMTITTGLVLAAVLFFAFLISRQLCEDIDLLRLRAGRIAEGDYSVGLNIESRDEIGDLARTFQRMAEQRQQAERIKDEFFANVSHELRTPLTLILSPLESLLGNSQLTDPSAQAALQTMHNNAIRLLQLVNGLLDFSKLEAGQVTVHREALLIAPLTQSIYNDFQPLLRAKQLDAQLEINASGPVQMDRYLYERMLFNLLSNAIKFTPPKGQIHLRVAWSADQLTFSVSDSGIGISEKDQANLFQRFRQVEGSSTRRYEGTGLGLALVKEFAELLQGSVSVQSTPGQGSTFTITCKAPAAKEAAEPGAAAAPRTRVAQYPQLTMSPTAPAGASLPCVLIAEDNVEMASYLVSVLKTVCRTELAGNGEEALRKIRTSPPDLVLTDVMMPERDGLSLCRAIKSDVSIAGIPVVMLTALTHRQALMEGWQAGADEYLFKPFHPEELITRLRSLLKAVTDRRKMETELQRRDSELAQSRKLEVVGRLAGGIAHDFNNLLTGIIGIGEDLAEDLATEPEKQQDAREIVKAAMRAAELTRQLLTLGGRQVVKPTLVEINAVLADMQRMLQRTIGEDVTIAVTAGKNMKPIKIGRGQLEQVILNLVLNARDAMPRGGRITIETDGVALQPDDPSRPPDVAAGTYSRLSISDTGTGMDPETRSHIFEPFFTTKARGRGVGLGLATVYGIVKQHSGYIAVMSEPGKGTTVQLFFPPSSEPPPTGSPAAEQTLDSTAGTETILVVEDEDLVRRAVTQALKKRGYTVLEAHGSEEALALSDRHAGILDLLITDVVMPGMNGLELGRALLTKRPGLRILYMSGYNENTLTHHGVIPNGAAFIEKTFTGDALAAKVRRFLDERTA